jgi:hypothetical protein
MTKHLVIPDCQIRPGDNLNFLHRIGQYIVDKQPDVIVCIGDFADMPSLSSYDVGKKAYEGRRYLADVQSVHDAMSTLLDPMINYNHRQQRNAKKQYHPRMVMTLGNHENRINRAVNSDPKLDGLLSTDDLCYSGFGWEEYPFLEVVIIDGIAYSHYFVTGVAGRAASTAAAQFRKTNMSCISGHQQGLHIHSGDRADGARLTSIIAGSCYEHDEDYLGPQGNRCWRGILMLHEVDNGQFDLMPVSLDYLKRKYE